MVEQPSSQVAPLPADLPFRIVSRTIGQGAYAFIRKACPYNRTEPVIAVKFIHKEHAFRHGKMRPKQLQLEIMLHKHLGKHKNIIEFLSAGDSPAYAWIAMELATGGDLFDKIEADVGIGEDIAHFYFTQLMNAVSYMHSKGVAHRDIKPENMLLSADGDLKIADFGLAALFKKDNEVRLTNTICGSPPYIAPEVVAGKRSKRDNLLELGYAPNTSDIWSCGVVLFVLLAGNTPWDEPTIRSYEFKEYVETNGRTSDELWQKLPQAIQSLLRGMLKLDPKERFSLDEVRTHPWFTRRNPHLTSAGTAANPLNLATQMLESLRVDFTADPTNVATHMLESLRLDSTTNLTHSQRQRLMTGDAMDVDQPDRLPATQPETPLAEMPFDWERPPRLDTVSASQPVRSRASTQHHVLSYGLLDQLQEDVTLSQFTPNPSVPLSLTQAARRFGDIIPAHSLARFLSSFALDFLVQSVAEALHRLGIPAVPDFDGVYQAEIRVKTVDGRQQGLNGRILIERWNEEVCEVRFVKVNGDPLEWRRFFKKMCILCKDAVLLPQ